MRKIVTCLISYLVCHWLHQYYAINQFINQILIVLSNPKSICDDKWLKYFCRMYYSDREHLETRQYSRAVDRNSYCKFGCCHFIMYIDNFPPPFLSSKISVMNFLMDGGHLEELDISKPQAKVALPLHSRKWHSVLIADLRTFHPVEKFYRKLSSIFVSPNTIQVRHRKFFVFALLFLRNFLSCSIFLKCN